MIKVNGVELDEDFVLDSRDVRAFVFVQKLKQDERIKNTSRLILADRKMVTELLNKTDDELKKIKKSFNVSYDRSDSKGANVPFTILE